MANGEASAQSSHTLPGDTEIPDPLSAVDGLSAVRRAITYRVNDATAPGGKKDVERDELAKGYLYGSTAVHIAESDENVTKLETTQGFTIIGFIPMDKVCKRSKLRKVVLTMPSTRDFLIWEKAVSLSLKRPMTKLEWHSHLSFVPFMS